MKKVVNVNYGIASSYDNFIEINVKLKGKLRKKILDHEKRHKSGKYSIFDFNNDFHSSKPHFFESLWFALFNPEALVGYMFFMYSYYAKNWTINQTAIFPFFYFGIIFSFFYSSYLSLFRINFFNLFLGCFLIWTALYCFFNIVLLIYTHIYVKIIS